MGVDCLPVVRARPRQRPLDTPVGVVDALGPDCVVFDPLGGVEHQHRARVVLADPCGEPVVGEQPVPCPECTGAFPVVDGLPGPACQPLGLPQPTQSGSSPVTSVCRCLFPPSLSPLVECLVCEFVGALVDLARDVRERPPLERRQNLTGADPRFPERRVLDVPDTRDLFDHEL